MHLLLRKSRVSHRKCEGQLSGTPGIYSPCLAKDHAFGLVSWMGSEMAPRGSHFEHLGPSCAELELSGGTAWGWASETIPLQPTPLRGWLAH